MAVGPRRGQANYTLAFALTIALFAVWGGAHYIFNVISQQFTQFFADDYLQSTITFLSLNLSYFLVAVPVALFLRRFSYKLGLVTGLGAFTFGALLLFPAIAKQEYAFYSTAVVVTGVGWAFLEVSANSLIVRMGSPDTAVRRLNLAQTLYPVGLIVASLFGQRFMLPPHGAAYGEFANIVVRPYVVLGLCVLLLSVVIENAEFPEVATERKPPGMSLFDEIRALWSRPTFRAGVVALAVSTTGIACLWGSVAKYSHVVLAVAPAGGWIVISMANWTLCALGRGVGSALMGRINPLRLLAVFAAFATALSAVPAFVDGVGSLGCLIAASFFISIMFPTIFGESVRDLGPLTKLGAGFLVAASGLGGFVGMMAQRVLGGYPGVTQVIVSVAALCFIVVLSYAVAGLLARRRAEAPAVEPAPGMGFERL